MLKKTLIILLSTLILSIANATSITDLATKNPVLIPNAQPQVLPPSEAFKLLITINKENQALEIHWQMPKDYYLYRDKIKIATPFPVTYTLPAGTEIIDEFFGDQIVYFDQLALIVPLPTTATEKFPLQLSYQGCASAGFCYPPITETWEVNRTTGAVLPANNAPEETAISREINALNNLEVTPSAVTNLLEQQNIGWILLVFYGLGLLLTFTPCVLPMIPILSSIIVGQNTTPRSWHSFALSLSYVSGMVATYTLAGVFAGLAGLTLQSYLQAPLFIGFSAAVLVLLAFSLFGFYRLQLPATLNNKLHQLTHHIRGGRYLSAIVLGILSALIVSPCVTAPLIGALTYISTTGNAILGGSALFTLALGMGTPLLIIGTLGPRLLPQAGEWLMIVQRIFGVLLISVAIWMVSRLLSAEITLAVWGIAAIVAASYLGALQTNVVHGWPRFWQAIAWIILLSGILLITYASKPLLQHWLPTAYTNTTTIAAPQNTFIPVKTWADIQQQIQQSDKPVLLDIYAEWCVTCKVIENYVFPDPQIVPLLKQFTLLRADVTAQDSADRALQRQLNIFAPPALLFFAPKGKELTDARLVGDITTAVLAQHLDAVRAAVE
jgi:thiol:disulfide interchange protein DsbD